MRLSRRSLNCQPVARRKALGDRAHMMTPAMASPKISYCEENGRLLNEFAQAVTELSLLHEQQFIAVLKGDGDFARFDLLIHLATEKKQQAKYAYLAHVDSH